MRLHVHPLDLAMVRDALTEVRRGAIDAAILVDIIPSAAMERGVVLKDASSQLMHPFVTPPFDPPKPSDLFLWTPRVREHDPRMNHAMYFAMFDRDDVPRHRSPARFARRARARLLREARERARRVVPRG